jgi:hypothetical protein
MWTCQHCGEQVKGHFIECSKCGYVKNWSPTDGEPVLPAPIPSEGESSVSKQTNSSAPIFYLLSGVLIVGAVIFTGVGLYTLYDNSSGSRIVGGDAYNYIIYAMRGTAFICAGIVCAVLSVTFALFAHTAHSQSSVS